MVDIDKAKHSVQRFSIKIMLLSLILVVMGSSLTVHAAPAKDLRAIKQGTAYYDENAVNQCSSTSALSGSDNQERAFFYFTGKGLTSEQAAGIVGNLMAESGMQPDRQETGQAWPKGGWGIAQWTATRRTTLVAAVQGAGLPYTNEQTPPDKVVPLLQFELDYLWNEATGRGDIDKLKQETLTSKDSAVNVRSAAASWERNFERPLTSHVDVRARFGIDAYNKYSGKSSGTVLSSGNSCGTGQSGGTVVEIAKRELANGATEANDGYLKYIPIPPGTRDQAWCAWFVSWVFKQAGRPFDGGIGDDGYAHPGVSEFKDYATKNGWFHPKNDASFIPQPGDVVIYSEGTGPYPSHVNIVISYDASTQTMTTIGGNENNSGQGGGKVHQAQINTNSVSISGYSRVP